MITLTDPLPTTAATDDEMLSRRFLMGRGRERMTGEQRRVVEASMTERREFPGRHLLVRQGEPVTTSMLLLDGYACRYMDDRDGYRQLVAIHVPGDFVDLHAFPMKRLDHDVASLGPVTVGIYDHKVLTQITQEHPRLTGFLWFSTLLDAAMHREWIFRLGRLGAEGRIAHFFCELNARLQMVGLADDGRFTLPLTQADLGEACGLTGVHVNRTLRMLRERGLMTFRGGEVVILDPRQLATIAEFEPAYLYGENDETTR